jgi:hypothetical protein
VLKVGFEAVEVQAGIDAPEASNGDAVEVHIEAMGLHIGVAVEVHIETVVVRMKIAVVGHTVANGCSTVAMVVRTGRTEAAQSVVGQGACRMVRHSEE